MSDSSTLLKEKELIVGEDQKELQVKQEQQQQQQQQRASAAAAAAEAAAPIKKENDDEAQRPSLYESAFMPSNGIDIATIDTPLNSTMLTKESLAAPTAALAAAGLTITKSYVDEKRWGERAIVLHNVITPDECRLLMQLTEKVEMHDASSDHRYRHMMRVELRSVPLAAVLFARIAQFVEATKVVTPENCSDYQQGPLMEGVWEILGLNDHFRCCYYDGDANKSPPHFGPHADGEYSPRFSVNSIKTFMIYLNTSGVDYEGGTTNFLNDHLLHFDAALQKFVAPASAVLARLAPKAGDVLLFDHKLLHEGSPVLSGKKFIFRSEIMFWRKECVVSAEEKEAREWLQKAKYHEDYKNGEEAVKCYKKAFKLWPALEKLC